MTLDEAQEQLRDTRLVAIIDIPRGFHDGVRAGETVPVNLTLDNVNLDVAEDVYSAAM